MVISEVFRNPAPDAPPTHSTSWIALQVVASGCGGLPLARIRSATSGRPTCGSSAKLWLTRSRVLCSGLAGRFREAETLACFAEFAVCVVVRQRRDDLSDKPTQQR
jgi:hypothetical protein